VPEELVPVIRNGRTNLDPNAVTKIWLFFTKLAHLTACSVKTGTTGSIQPRVKLDQLGSLQKL
jgi:hypothetical protein